MRFAVDDQSEELRSKVGLAIEYDRELDVNIHGSLARLAIQSTERVREPEDAACLMVRFVMPNAFRIEELEIPEDNSRQAFVKLYPKQD